MYLMVQMLHISGKLNWGGGNWNCLLTEGVKNITRASLKRSWAAWLAQSGLLWTASLPPSLHILHPWIGTVTPWMKDRRKWGAAGPQELDHGMGVVTATLSLGCSHCQRDGAGGQGPDGGRAWLMGVTLRLPHVTIWPWYVDKCIFML